MPSYCYKEVSQAFVDDLTQLLVDGQSAVLLSPRFIGKRYVALNVRDRLRNCPEGGSIVEVRWLSDRPFGTRQQAVQAMNEAVGHTARPIGLQVEPGKEMFDAVDELYAKTGKPVILLAANVDAMGHHLARVFLQEAQRRVEARTLVVLLGGEVDFLGSQPSTRSSWRAWPCVERREPCVFAWKDDCPNLSQFQTSRGLTVLNVRNPKCPERVRKQPGDFWIDFPGQVRIS